jgi:hypothetical protein
VVVNRRATITVAVLAAAFAALQCVPVDRSNPAVHGDLVAPPEVKAALRRACFDCHSNETTWPWYSQMAPLSWLMARDVKRGRQRLNFSDWADYASDPETQQRKLDQIVESVRRGDMAPWYYRVLHSGARLDPSQGEVILRWGNQAAHIGTPLRAATGEDTGLEHP